MVVFVNVLWLLASIFLILVILVQRGRGGGLAGALGGIGGASAFGTRAGDVFTKITVVVFFVWLLLGLILVPMMTRPTLFTAGGQAETGPAAVTAPAGETDQTAPAGESDQTAPADESEAPSKSEAPPPVPES